MSYDDLPNDGWGSPPKDLPGGALTAAMIAGGAVLAGLLLMVAVAGVDALVRAATVGPTPAPTATVTAYVPVPGPVTTVTATARPEPGPTVTVTARPSAASRSLTRLSAQDEAFLRCVMHRESRGDPKAENPHSTASGLFQFLDGTWRSVTRASGIGTRYDRASDAPSSVQWSVARWTVEHIGRHPWRPTVPGTGC